MSSKYIAVAAALALSAYVGWIAVDRTADHHPLRTDSPLSLRLQPSANAGVRRRAKETRKKGKKPNNRPSGSSSGNGGNAVSLSQMASRHDKWKIRGGRSGLRLRVINSLQPKNAWDTALRTSVREWNGSRAILLSLLRTHPDATCAPTPMAIKVCNGDYGDTRWKAVTNSYFMGDEIVAARIQMNDHYLNGMDAEERQYTVCHEMGHGLGLRHSDEDFNNVDLRDCMDYTHRHEINMHPGRANLRVLRKLYGNLNGGVRRLVNDEHDMGDVHMTEDEERQLREEMKKAYSGDPLDVMAKDVDANASMEGLRILQKTDTAGFYLRDLGNGLTVLTSVLLA